MLNQNPHLKYKLLIIAFLSIKSFSQITGLITDKNNEPLPFVNVYIKNTYTGTNLQIKTSK